VCWEPAGRCASRRCVCAAQRTAVSSESRARADGRWGDELFNEPRQQAAVVWGESQSLEDSSCCLVGIDFWSSWEVWKVLGNLIPNATHRVSVMYSSQLWDCFSLFFCLFSGLIKILLMPRVCVPTEIPVLLRCQGFLRLKTAQALPCVQFVPTSSLLPQFRSDALGFSSSAASSLRIE